MNRWTGSADKILQSSVSGEMLISSCWQPKKLATTLIKHHPYRDIASPSFFYVSLAGELSGCCPGAPLQTGNERQQTPKDRSSRFHGLMLFLK